MDFINHRGEIVPTILSRHKNGLESVGVYAIKFQSLDDEKVVEIIYVGDMGEFIKSEHKKLGYVIEPGKRDELANTFPRWGQWILNNN